MFIQLQLELVDHLLQEIPHLMVTETIHYFLELLQQVVEVVEMKVELQQLLKEQLEVLEVVVHLLEQHQKQVVQEILLQ